MEELMVLCSVAVFQDALHTYFDLICLRGIFWYFTTQDNFVEFADVDEIYQSLPLVEALENLDAIPIVPPAIVVKEKVPS
jgi:hypothetical protein